MSNLLVTGAGGIGGVDFIRAVRLADAQRSQKSFIVGVDSNRFYVDLPDVDVRFLSTLRSDDRYLSEILGLVEKHNVGFVHPQSSIDAKLFSAERERFEKLGAQLYLPPASDIRPDKYHVSCNLSMKDVRVPRTGVIRAESDIKCYFAEIGSPLWMRARTGVGGRLGLKVSSVDEANAWLRLNLLQKRVSSIKEFIMQEYLPGRDIAFDSLWFDGRLVLSYARVRLEYPFKNISLSGLTGTPSVARIIHEPEVNRLGVAAVKALNPSPHGFYSVDIKEDAEGNPVVTEVDGKWHTTASLWGYAFAKMFNEPRYNIVSTYLDLGLGLESPSSATVDLFPADYVLIRQMDSGVILRCENGKGGMCRVA